MINQKNNVGKHRVQIFNEDGSVSTSPVVSLDAECVETKDGIYRICDSVKRYDVTTGGFLFMFDVPEVAKVEATTLKNLRRSMAIKNIFTYDREKVLDLKTMMPYVIALAVVLFS